jgi:hypothetical protein
VFAGHLIVMETIPDYYYGLPLFDVKPFEEGTEPVPFDFHVHDTYPPVIMRGYNFSGDTLPAGIPILLVLDMFQRLVYSKKVQEEPIITAQLGRIEEPVVSSPYRRYTPNFVGTNLEGILIEKSRRDILPTYKHHLSCGFVRLEGKYYAPIQATHEGGEEYLNDDGMLSIRFRGDLRFDREGRALYLLGRKVSRDSRYFALHQDFYFARNRTGNHAFNNSLHSDSPFLFEYLDGRECNFNINPIPIGGVFPEEWELTTDFTKAQYNYDICLAPDAADGECFVKGEVLCFRRKVALMKAPAFRQNGTLIENVWRWSAYTYYEAIPYPEYLEPLRGQGKTKSYYFRSLPHRIEVVSVNSADRPDVSHYARLQLVDNSGLPELHNEERVCRLCEYFPSRGVFYKMDEDGIRYPIIVTPDTSEGSGIPTATAHQAFDEITHQCTTVVEHKQHRIIRQGAELLLTAVSECWRQCGMIEGTIPPDLGDPRALPKRIIFVETRTDVTGQMPDITSLMSGTFLNLVTGQLFAYSEYRSAMPMYPPAPDPAVMWNPGELSRPGFDFLGFVTYRNAPEPLFMLSGDLPAHTLFPVWQHRNATREFVRVTFCGCNFPGDNSWQVGNKTATMQVPKGMVLDTKYYNPINVPEINPEHGFYFGGWSNSVHGTIAITCNSDMILRPVASDSPLPLEDGEHWVTFVGGEINPVPFKAADEMELDLKQFIVSSENRIFLGWSTEAAGEIIEEY